MSRRSRGVLGGLAALAVGLLAWLAVVAGGPPSRPEEAAGAVGGRETAAQARAAAGADRSAPAAASPVASVSSGPPLPPLPGSLRGTEVDGALLVDEDGHFVASEDARRLFDYFLAASGEEPPDVLRARIVVEIRARLAPPASDEAEALLDRYLAYRDAARDLAERGQAPDDLERRLQWVRELRRATLGAADAQALFGDEEEQAERELERRRIAVDPDLTPEERARRLEPYGGYPPEMAHLALALDEAALREERASPGEIHALRAERFGPAAADRLDALDARRAEWERRMAAYRAERDALLAQPWDDPAARAGALDGLRHRTFSDAEARRAAALDRIDGVE